MTPVLVDPGPQVLCEASATLVKKRGIKLPPTPDVGCYRNAAGDTAVETRGKGGDCGKVGLKRG